MRVCDRHMAVRAVDSVTLGSTHETFDLCAECIDMIKAALCEPVEAPKRRGRPPKEPLPNRTQVQ